MLNTFPVFPVFLVCPVFLVPGGATEPEETIGATAAEDASDGFSVAAEAEADDQGGGDSGRLASSDQ